jgi:hypothetical protein
MGRPRSRIVVVALVGLTVLLSLHFIPVKTSSGFTDEGSCGSAKKSVKRYRLILGQSHAYNDARLGLMPDCVLMGEDCASEACIAAGQADYEAAQKERTVLKLYVL